MKDRHRSKTLLRLDADMSSVRLLLLVDLAAQQLCDTIHQTALLIARVLCCVHASCGSIEWNYKLINSGISPGAWQGVLFNATKAAGKASRFSCCQACT